MGKEFYKAFVDELEKIGLLAPTGLGQPTGIGQMGSPTLFGQPRMPRMGGMFRRPPGVPTAATAGSPGARGVAQTTM